MRSKIAPNLEKSIFLRFAKTTFSAKTVLPYSVSDPCSFFGLNVFPSKISLRTSGSKKFSMLEVPFAFAHHYGRGWISVLPSVCDDRITAAITMRQSIFLWAGSLNLGCAFQQQICKMVLKYLEPAGGGVDLSRSTILFGYFERFISRLQRQLIKQEC